MEEETGFAGGRAWLTGAGMEELRGAGKQEAEQSQQGYKH